MRALTSIQSATNIKATLEFHVKLSDQSTTFIFDRNDITDLSPINWEIPFGGGFGKPSNYKITLATSVDFIKTYRKGLINAESSLKVFVNSDNFVPSIGRVRNLTRFPANLNLIELQVYDKFLDSNPKVPALSIVDSYSVVHPEVINSDMGYPLYYGKHTRPFYMTAVDCNINTLLGPRNVSSANHVTSLWFNVNIEAKTKSEFLLLKSSWNQYVDGNATTSSYPFELTGGSPELKQPFVFSTVRQTYNDVYDMFVDEKSEVIGSKNYGKYEGRNTKVTSGVQVSRYTHIIQADNNTAADILRTSSFVGSISIFNYYTDGLKKGTHNMYLYGLTVSPTTDSLFSKVFFSNVDTEYSSFQSDLSSENMIKYMFEDDFKLFLTMAGDIVPPYGFSLYSTYNIDYVANVQLTSASYKNYSIFGTPVNCSEVAVSENPMGITASIVDQTSFSFVATQNSQSQYETQSYHLQCFIGQRKNLIDILDEFGKISSTYMWAGDSGFINFNTYQNSQTITTSALIAATISTSDFIMDSLTIRDNPLGTTVFDTQKASRFKVDYDYNFQTGRYEQSNVANPQNNAYCNSAYAGGIQTNISVKTQYIKEAYTSSLYLRNIIRNATQDEQIVEMSLPARFFNLELSDVIKLQHPVLVGSESLFQITKINPDYLKGTVRITANEIQNI